MKMADHTERPVVATSGTLKCSHVKKMKIDGEIYECNNCTDPGCQVHGLEAQVKAQRQYNIAPNETPYELGAVDFKGPDRKGKERNSQL